MSVSRQLTSGLRVAVDGDTARVRRAGSTLKLDGGPEDDGVGLRGRRGHGEAGEEGCSGESEELHLEDLECWWSLKREMMRFLGGDRLGLVRCLMVSVSLFCSVFIAGGRRPLL